MHGIQMPHLFASMHGEEMDIGDSDNGIPCICRFNVEVKVWRYTFYTLCARGGGWSVPCFDHFTPRKHLVSTE